jgi:probable F420-dependent oxidoreductase
VANGRIRVGFQAQPQHADYATMRAAWAEADAIGVDTIWTWDHFFPLYGEADGKHFECWTLIAAMAEVTATAEVGALVTCNSYRNPQLLADMARTVDHISGGRLILGVGAGWFERDYREFGYDFGTAGSRVRALRDAVPLIKERMQKGNPPPNRRVPWCIPGKGPKVSLRVVAEHADIWHTFGTEEQLAESSATLDAWCRELGRDPSEVERSTGLTGGKRLGADAAEALLALGFTHFIYGSCGPEYDLATLRELVAWRDERNGR